MTRARFIMSEDHKLKISKANSGRRMSIGTEFKKGHPATYHPLGGELHPRWKGGVSKNREYRKKQLQEWRKNNPQKARRKYGGKLTNELIRLVYEDNIKKYGTLTCYLCFNPIKIKDDHLEHKLPLIRGGMNTYDNLSISCSSCNRKKWTRTEEEYRAYLLNKKN